VTIYLDRRFRQVGRIKKAAGTDHKPTVTRLNEMLTGLFERGRLDILRGIQSGQYSPLQVYDAYRLDELHKLPTAASLALLEPAMKDWIAKAEWRGKNISEDHRRSLNQSLRNLLAVAGGRPTVGDLPKLVARYRTKAKENDQAQSFNKARSAAQAFLRSTLKRSHALYAEISDIETLAVTPKFAKRPQTVEQMRELVKALGANHGPSAWAMAVTGMGPNEYWGKWHIDSDRIHIDGTKRRARVRDVPLIERIARPYATKEAFAERLIQIGAPATPYDFRRTYANWMEKAKIDRTNRRLYMGHKAKDVTDLYEDHALLTRILNEDAEAMRKYIGSATDAASLRLEKTA
jgi:integrase